MAYAAITKPSLHFNTITYTGTGSSNAVTGVGFQPDFIWFKCRSEAQNHNLFDAVRGSNKIIQSSTSNAEATSTALLTSFDSDGFTVNTDDGVNGSSKTYASWNWKANGAGSSNSDGSQSSTVSVNTTAGVSIVKFVNNTSYTANTFGHGLGAVPKVIMMRSLDDAYNWDFHHHTIAISKRLVLNSNAAQANSTYMNSTSPTNQVFTVKSDEFGSNSNCIAYCFAEKKGFSKFGFYTSNNTADNGPFVYTGFKPAFVLTKLSTTGGADWRIFDNRRNTYNGDRQYLRPNNTDAESSGTSQIDLLSNGFKFRGPEGDSNYNTETGIYMAFAAEPLVANVGNSIPATAV